MPAVNFDRMCQAMVNDAKAGKGSNKIVYWSRLFGWKNQTLTPNPAKSVAYGKRIKLYPLSQAAHPPETMFVDAIDVVYYATIPYDMRFFQSLDSIVQTEPWIVRDKPMIDQLRSIGIEKGKPFNPDAKTQDALTWLVNYYEALISPRRTMRGATGSCPRRRS